MKKQKKKEYHGKSCHPLYRRWSYMMTRCYNKNIKKWKVYGGRGIRVCERWHEFGNFYDDNIKNFKKELSLDRIDNDGDYSPQNCQWVTNNEQMRNQQATKKIVFNGKETHLLDVKKVTGIPYRTLVWRYDRGWPVEDIIRREKYISRGILTGEVAVEKKMETLARIDVV